MSHPASSVLGRVLIPGVVLLAIGAAAVAVWRTDPWGERGSGLPERFDLDLSKQTNIDPALICYASVDTIDVAMKQLRAIAVGPDDRIFVAGDRAVHVLDSDGRPVAQIPIDDAPACLAVGSGADDTPARLYVGTKDRVLVFQEDGTPVAAWDSLGESALLTSIAVGDQEVFVADAGNRVVHRFDTSGKPLGRIGQPDPDRQMPGFVIPSPYFDVAVGPDAAVYVANTGARRIETYTSDGDLDAFWGQTGSDIGDFFGCCNPAHFAVLPDGRFVTSEKGIVRVKVYSDQGEFQCVVAGPQQLEIDDPAAVDAQNSEGRCVFDVAVDRQGRVLVLDGIAGKVRVFSPRSDAVSVLL